MLPKPSVLTMPSMHSPMGVGMGACNSANQCPSQKCDITKAHEEYDGTDDFNWGVDMVTWLLGLFK
ncbi:MAG: hypothetical protein K6B15_02975 [Parasporobacterium sp.]|nr:hypothetical protein [Parasporobacterium sp.]